MVALDLYSFLHCVLTHELKMDVLADILQPYKELVGNVAAIVGMGQMFSGVFICLDIYKQKNTKGIPFMPFLGGMVITILGLKFGLILQDDKMIQLNVFGFAINILYMSVYLYFTEQKTEAFKQIGLGGLFTAALIGYAQIEDPSLVEARFGSIITAFLFILIASPLFGLKDIIKNQSTEGLPFPMILSGTMVSFSWLVYGIILRNMFIVMQNVVALSLCSAQLLLFIIYPSKPKQK